METFYQILFYTGFLLAAVLMFWGVKEIKSLRTRYYKTQARAESNRRVFNLFLHKLATEKEIYDAMNIIAPQICEDLDAESVGIFVPDYRVSSKEGPLTLRGISCTGYFPVMTGNFTRDSNTRVYDNLRFRMAFFRNETFREGEGLLGHACEMRTPMLLNTDAIQLAEYPVPSEIYTMMILPLLIEDRFSGLICAVNRSHSIQPFNETDMKQFAELSTTVALTSSLIIIYAERASQDRLKRELEFSVNLQKALLPDIPPLVGDFRVAAISKACHEVSGDFYDYVELNEDVVMILVADATGKGIPACMMTSMCRSFVRSLAERYVNLKQFMLDLNRLVYENSDDAHYLTANVIVIDRHSNMCNIACAGHPPILAAQANGSIQLIKPDGPALGMWPNEFADFPTQALELEPGMQLCVFTDGINEALNDKDEEFGMDRLISNWQAIAARQLEPDQAAQALLDATQAYVGDVQQSDDQTILVIGRATP